METAIAFVQRGLNPIPVNPETKVPCLESWKPYEEQRVTEEEVRQWWQKSPRANIGVLTGQKAGFVVVDCDSEEAIRTVEGLLPDTLQTPAASTPRGGRHIYFQYRPGLTNRSGAMQKVDVRTDGGYIITPPSKRSIGSYSWLPGLALNECPLASMPDALFNALNKNSINTNIECRDGNPSDFNRLQVTSSDFKEGGRDQALFSLAHHLLKGGMPEASIRNYLHFFAKNCEPPFPAAETEIKIQSALQRKERAETSLAEEVRDFVVTSSGFWMTSECFNRLQVTSRAEKKAVTLELLRLHKKGIIERHGNKNGCYRRIENDVEPLDWRNADTSPLNLRWPFEIEKLVRVYPQNIGVIAGAPNAGKSAFIFNFIKLNQQNHEVHLFSSEGGKEELRLRLSRFGLPLDSWTFHAWDRGGDFADVIKPDAVNIIDYLEVHEDFFRVGGMLKNISDKLKNGFCLVALQKNFGRDEGLGGARGLEKPRLYLAMEAGRLKIVKGKSWANRDRNPNGLTVDFKLVDGCHFITKSVWRLRQ